MISTVVCCHWMAALPAPAVDASAPTPEEASPAQPPAPELPHTPKDTGVIPGVLPPVIPNVMPMPSLSGDPGLPGDPNLPAVPAIPGAPQIPGEADAPDDKVDAPVEPAAPENAFANLAGFPLGDGVGDSLLAGFHASATLSGTYNTNITQGQQQIGNQPTADFFTSLGANFNYLSKPGPFTFGGNYRGRYDEYMSRSEFSGYSQGGGLVGNYKANHFTVSATGGIDENRGSPQNYSSAMTFGGSSTGNYNQSLNRSNVNRINKSASILGSYEGPSYSISANAGFDMDSGGNNYSSAAASSTVETTRIHTGLSGRYEISPKTSLTGGFSQSSSTSSGGGYGDTSTYDFTTAALWKYSQLTEFGPGIHYSYSSGTGYGTGISTYGGSQLARTTLGPTINCNYKLDGNVSRTSQLGLDFARYDNGQSGNPSLSGSLAVNYQASVMWGMNLSMSRSSQADPTSVGAFYESNSLRLGYHHNILRASLNAGISYQTSNSVVPSGVTTGRPNSDVLSLDTTLSMPVFANKGSASVFVRYNDQSGVNSINGSSGNSWNAFQVGATLTRSF